MEEEAARANALAAAGAQQLLQRQHSSGGGAGPGDAGPVGRRGTGGGWISPVRAGPGTSWASQRRLAVGLGHGAAAGEEAGGAGARGRESRRGVTWHPETEGGEGDPGSPLTAAAARAAAATSASSRGKAAVKPPGERVLLSAAVPCWIRALARPQFPTPLAPCCHCWWGTNQRTAYNACAADTAVPPCPRHPRPCSSCPRLRHIPPALHAVSAAAVRHRIGGRRRPPPAACPCRRLRSCRARTVGRKHIPREPLQWSLLQKPGCRHSVVAQGGPKTDTPPYGPLPG